MNRRQKEVLQSQLNDEKAVLQALEKNYTTALADIKNSIKILQADNQSPSKAYQISFQQQLEKQYNTIIDNLQNKNYNSISEYLEDCYNSGFIGTMYDLQGQGIPLVLPIDQKQVLKAVQKTGDDIKIANKIGVSTKLLKKQVLSEVQRGIATQLSYVDIARNISNRGQASLNRSMTIARTEGHRVQNESKMDALVSAKSKGADIVKQWDSTLDGRTRESHRSVDGEIKQLEEKFSNGLMHPGDFSGRAAEVCNCRCCLLQRARWAVKDETSYQKWNNETGGFIECSGYQDFKEKYLNRINNDDIIFKRSVERKNSNYGVFKNLQVPMQKKAVLAICKKYNVDTKGLTIKIQRSESLLSKSIYGSTDYDNIGRIDLFPNAFANEDEILKTVIHEKCHVEQLKRYGKKYCQDHLFEMEEEAYKVQEEMFTKLKGVK